MEKEIGILIEELLKNTGFAGSVPERVEALPASGSQRRYFRIYGGGKSLLACVSADREENRIFLRLSSMLHANGIRGPRIYSVSADSRAYLLEDLGDTDLLSVILQNKEDAGPLINETISQLVRFQRLPRKEWETVVGFPPLDTELVNHDFRYAVENLFVPLRTPFDSDLLEADFRRLERRLLAYPRNLWGLMYRDFQSRNIMVAGRGGGGGGSPFFIDYQSSRLGPGIYDLVSFAWQAKAAFDDRQRGAIIDRYCECMEEYIPGCGDEIREAAPFWAAFRVIQTLGAYGLRGLKEGKEHFIESIPAALHNLLLLLETERMVGQFPELTRIVRGLISFL